ncbi:hypothetical protein QBC38DRAFT_478618 [Podospora fimiseda]|uniref:RING-type E3 ubiquitin transferase n=1 Tax=Podospora fimiseda TaxID=252190 RepID=A0AAN7BP00_9PEZI|nr:hypothetical protein QBC38DRAFT_478618 [Podospora fimiseda]
MPTEGGTTTPPRRDPFPTLLLILILYMFMNGGDTPVLSPDSASGASILSQQREAFGVLNSTKYGDFSPKEKKEGLPGDPPWEAPRYLNVTGFREKDGYAWEDLEYFKTRCLQWSKNAYPPQEGAKDWWDHGIVKQTWQNVTGAVQGKYVRRQGSVVKTAADYNLTAIAPDVEWPEDHHHGWGWNITGSEGTVIFRLKEGDDEEKSYYEKLEKSRGGPFVHPASLARETTGVLTLQDGGRRLSSIHLKVNGVHWPLQGSMLLTTTSEKFFGIFGLPHFAPDADFFRTSQGLLNQTVDRVLRKREQRRFSNPTMAWSSVVEDEDETLPHCEYIVYLQLYPLEQQYLGGNPRLMDVGSSAVQLLEKELRFPTGRPSKGTPDLHMSMVAWSPDCSYYIESKGPPLFPSDEGHHLVGVLEQVYTSRAQYSLVLWLFAFVGQVYLLKMQIKESPTPSTLSRLSTNTIFIMVLVDIIILTGSLGWAFQAIATFPSSMLLAFASFMSASIGAGFLGSIQQNNPERRAREREREQTLNNSNTANNATNANNAPPPTVQASTDTLPLPATAVPQRPSSPPIIIPSDQDIDAEIAEQTAAAAGAAGRPPPPGNPARMMGITFVATSLVFLVLTSAALNWAPRPRTIYITIVTFLYFSLWWPQIWRNARRASRKSFSWSFIVGQSLCRLVPFAYVYLYEDNILFAEVDPTTFAFLMGWVWLQWCVMAAQSVWEPRLGIPFPRGWMPEVWDYHMILRQEDVESGAILIGSDVGEVGGSLREKSKELKQRGMTLRSIDCAICREEMFVPVVMAGREDPSWSMADMMERKQYMITPCRHMFHTKCLEQWFRKRLACPICREDLQPL